MIAKSEVKKGLQNVLNPYQVLLLCPSRYKQFQFQKIIKIRAVTLKLNIIFFKNH